MDVGSYYTDNLLSADFKVVSSKKKSGRQEFKVPQNYWRQSAQKFRPFRVKQKQVIPLNREFIERSPYRLDSFGETSRLNYAKLQAQERKRQQELKSYNQRINNMFGMAQPMKTGKGKNKKAYGFSNIDKLTGYDPNLRLI